jgi:cell division transport system permease protein
MVLVIGGLTAATSHATVVAYLSDIDVRQPDGG